MITNRLYREKEVTKLLNPSNQQTILDIGGGTGRYATHLSQYAGHITLVDISTKMTEKIAQNSKITIINENFLNTDLTSMHYDFVIMCDVYHHLRDKNALLEKITLHLKKGGKLLIYDFDKSFIKTGLFKLFEEILFFERLFFEKLSHTRLFIKQYGFREISIFRDKNMYIALWEKE